MIIDFLTTKYRSEIDEGWGAFSLGNYKKAEGHFRNVLAHEEDSHMTLFDVVEAHNGIGAVNMAHKDFFEATRWFQEAYYLLNEFYKGEWPKTLSWASYHDRGAMRTLISLGKIAQEHKEFKKAKRFYSQLIHADKKDELGVTTFLKECEKNTVSSQS